MPNENDIIRRIRRNCTALNRALTELKELHANAQFYLDGTYNLNVMTDDPHDENGRPQRDRILASAYLHAGGGDW
jgi:hypothetical protein